MTVQDIAPPLIAEGLPAPDFLGREHFVMHGPEIPLAESAVALRVFGLLVTRAVYKDDTRAPNLGLYGLVVLPRSDAELGELPAFAFHHPGDVNVRRMAEFAIGTDSLISCISSLREKSFPIPRLDGPSNRAFLDRFIWLLRQGRQ